MGDVSHERLYCKDEKWICVWLLIKYFPLSRAETWLVCLHLTFLELMNEIQS